MCDTTPQVLSARVFAADGVTPVPGKGPLVQGTDYSLVYNGAACELTFNDADRRFGDRCGRTSDHRVSHAARRRYAVRHHADERGRRDGVVQRRRHESEPQRLHAHPDRRHRRHRRPRGRAHRHGRAAAVRREGGGAASRRACRRASSTRATCCATRSGSTTTALLPITQAVLRDIGAREHDVRRRLDDAERPARAAGPTAACRRSSRAST